MNLDKGSFFLALGTLAVGGVGGYAASEQGVFRHPDLIGVTDRQPSQDLTQPATPKSEPVAVQTAPTCDDAIGAPGACPPPGYPSEEGGCGSLPTKRCEDFKQAMKPHVAEEAVACLTALNGAQRCDPNRLALCGHAALMNACSASEPPRTLATAGGTPATPDELASRCESISRACPAGAAPSARECRATLVGLSAVGREKIAACMSTHCADKGLFGCEAVMDLPK